MVYLVTFTTYGTHLPGDARGSFDHVRRGEHRFLAPNAVYEKYHRSHMRQAPYVLADASARELVRDAIVDVCEFRRWILHAVHVRTNHVHVITDTDGSPQRALNDWKSYATRRLRNAKAVAQDRLIWTHGASIERLDSDDAVRNAIRYVLAGQGETLQIFVGAIR